MSNNVSRPDRSDSSSWLRKLVIPAKNQEISENVFLVNSVSPEVAGWRYSGIWVYNFKSDAAQTFCFDRDEICLVPLEGLFNLTVRSDKGINHYKLGRRNPFDEVTDVLYVCPGPEILIQSELGHIALITARSNGSDLVERIYEKKDMPIEYRGRGMSSRRINKFLGPEREGPTRLLGVEVFTPSGNFSSFPPHKHDQNNPCIPEVELEEIYFFMFTNQGSGFMRMNDSKDEFSFVAEVHTGDIVLVPRGYHGPTVAMPTSDMYFLNVLAGKDHRKMDYCDEKCFKHIRNEWEHQQLDERVVLDGSRT